ncbi:hypothetical protein, partial [Belliella pelovolcani]|uniref:hypothetical protein n=1 Tax=Belliella pelovolcani TaxID=529505 RepID=UPI003918D747
ATFMAATGVNIVITAKYADDTEEDFTTMLGDLAAFRAFGIKLETPTWTKALKFFQIKLTGLIGGSMESLNFYYTSASRFKKELFYLNSLGGYESVIFTGKTEESDNFQGDIIEGQLFPSESDNPGNYQVVNQRHQDELILRSGYINDRQRKAINDMLLRNEVYLRDGNSLRKLIIANATYPRDKDGEFLNSVTIQARYAFENSALSR